MPDYRISIREIVASLNVARREPGASLRAALDLVRPRIQSIAEDVLRDRDPGGMLLAVSLINVLIDCCREAVPGDVADRALETLEGSLEAGALRDFVLQGPPLAFDNDGLETMAGTLLRFEVFRRFYDAKYGLSADSASDDEELWSFLAADRAEIPVEDLPLGHGLMWFTEEDGLRRACPPRSAGEALDGSQAYERLGLNWSGLWEEYNDLGHGRSRAVLISALFRRRGEAPEGLRIPTGLDGWCSLLFVPRSEITEGIWPTVAGFTVDPRTGEACQPEGVHGDVSVPRGEICRALTCGEISKEIPDRTEECGELIVQRALERLQKI